MFRYLLTAVAAAMVLATPVEAKRAILLYTPMQKLVRAAFGKRRKMLRNALADLLAGQAAAEVFAAAGVDPAARAESLDLAAFAALSRALATGKTR